MVNRGSGPRPTRGIRYPVTVFFSDSPPAVTAFVAGAVVTGAAGACCDLAPFGASTIAADATASAARKRLVNLLSMLLLGFCLKSNAANSYLIQVGFRLACDNDNSLPG